MIKRLMTCLLTAAVALASASSVGGDDIQNTDSAAPLKMRTVYLNLDLSREVNPDDGVYYAAHRSTDGTLVKDDLSGRMSRAVPYEKDDRTWQNMLSAEIPEEYDQIRFSPKKIKNTGVRDLTSGMSELFAIPNDLKSPCLYLDDEDPSTYEHIERGGTWMEAGSIRYPEKEAAEKGNVLTDIPEKDRSESEDIRYLPVELYDDYSDQELNGIPKSLYGENGMTNRSLVPFRIFDRMLSDAYRKSGATPLYTGHFQPDGGQAPFSKIAPLLNLFGWEDPGTFFAVNNSLLDANGENHPQNYASASQGLVANELSGDSLMDSSGKGELPYFDETFLRGANSRNVALGQIYKDVAFPFTKIQKEDGTSAWSFDSSKDHVHLMKDEEGLYLDNPTQNGDEWSKNVDSSGFPDSPALSDAYGFFPFNDVSAKSGKNYNFGFGAKIGFDFYLPDDGVLKSGDGNVHPVTFSFSGDDDVWVFIDGKLALDVGGDHGKVEGDLDFHDLTAHVSSVKQSRTNQNVTRGPQTRSFTMDTQKGKLHHLTMYYLERGMWESNLKIEYSLSPKPFEPTEEPTKKPTPEPSKTPTPQVTKEPSPIPTEESTPEPTKKLTPEPSETPSPTLTEEPDSTPTEIPESVSTPSPEPTGDPVPKQPKDSIPTKPEEKETPTPEPVSESASESTDKPMPEAEEASEPARVKKEFTDSVDEVSSETESFEEASSIPEMPKGHAWNQKKQPFTASAGGKSTESQTMQSKTAKTSAVKTGDVPLKAIIIPILSGLLTLYAYIRRKGKKK